MEGSTIEKIAGGILIVSTLADGISMALLGNRIQDYIPSETISGMYHGLTQGGPALALAVSYLPKKLILESSENICQTVNYKYC